MMRNGAILFAAWSLLPFLPPLLLLLLLPPPGRSFVGGASASSPGPGNHHLEEEVEGEGEGEGQGPGSSRTGTIIGIDLGTTYSCVGVHRRGVGVEIVTNDQGNRITPSYVSFVASSSSSSSSSGGDGVTRLVGDSARNRAVIDPENTVFDVKRLMGRKFTDESVQSDMRLMPYRIVGGRGGDDGKDDDRPYVAVDVYDDDDEDDGRSSSRTRSGTSVRRYAAR